MTSQHSCGDKLDPETDLPQPCDRDYGRKNRPFRQCVRIASGISSTAVFSQTYPGRTLTQPHQKLWSLLDKKRLPCSIITVKNVWHGLRPLLAAHMVATQLRGDRSPHTGNKCSSGTRIHRAVVRVRRESRGRDEAELRETDFIRYSIEVSAYTQSHRDTAKERLPALISTYGTELQETTALFARRGIHNDTMGSEVIALISETEPSPSRPAASRTQRQSRCYG